MDRFLLVFKLIVCSLCAAERFAVEKYSRTFPGHNVGIDNGTPELPQHRRHSAFPWGDSSRQPDQEHLKATTERAALESCQCWLVQNSIKMGKGNVNLVWRHISLKVIINKSFTIRQIVETKLLQSYDLTITILQLTPLIDYMKKDISSGAQNFYWNKGSFYISFSLRRSSKHYLCYSTNLLSA